MGKPEQGKIRVSFIQRKPRTVGNYSVEFIFKDVRTRLAGKIESREIYSRYESSGLFRRIYNCIELIGKQSTVNHVTGDISYVGIFLHRKRTIQTILDCVFLTNSSGIKFTILKLFWLTIPVKRSRFITAISEATKKEILKYVSCDPDKIVVIPVAISDRFTRKDRPFNSAKPKILQLGTAPNKNIPRLIEALQGISCTLDIVGKKDDSLEAQLKSSGISYNYSSGLSDEEILQKYEQSDIVSLASTYEGFGMPILEAQAIGRPVVTSNLLSMPEVAGEAACLVDPFQVLSIRQGIQRIINEPEYRESLVNKGFENIKRYDANAIALQYYSLYRKIEEEESSF